MKAQGLVIGDSMSFNLFQEFDIKGFFVKIGSLAIFLLLSNPLILVLLGVLNRLFGRPIHSHFLAYAANKKYPELYVFKSLIPFFQSYPFVMGFFIQGGKIGVFSAISSTEDRFSNKNNLRQITKNTEFISKLLGVRQTNYSGILPTQLKKYSLISDVNFSQRSEIVSAIVYQSERAVRRAVRIDVFLPVILLGGRGTIGRQVARKLKESGREYYIVDKGDEFPNHLVGEPTVLIDVARKGALEGYLDLFWENLIVINETYPEPSLRIRNRLKSMGIPLYHIVGVSAYSFPSFPKAYAGGVPCCAVNNLTRFQPMVKKKN